MAAPVQSFTAIGLVLALLGPGVVALLSKRYAGPGHSLGIRALGLVAFLVLVLLVVAIARYGEKLDAEIGRAHV